MHENEAKKSILEGIKTTRQLVTLAKAFLLHPSRRQEFRPEDIAGEFAAGQGYPPVKVVVLHPSVEVEGQLAQVAGRLSCVLAFGQALRELIGEGYYMFHGEWKHFATSQDWTTVGSGQSGGWSFDEIKHSLPYWASRSPFFDLLVSEPFTDPDIFAINSGLEAAHPDVVEAIRDATLCLRHGLYRPAVTQLGKAMEGAWTELGLALARTLPSGNPERDKAERNMASEDRGLARKIADVRGLYAKRELVESVIRDSGIRPEELDSSVLWSDVLREARNAIHFGTRPAVANTYEKVVVLFLDGAKCLTMMYKIKKIADSRLLP